MHIKYRFYGPTPSLHELLFTLAPTVPRVRSLHAPQECQRSRHHGATLSRRNVIRAPSRGVCRTADTSEKVSRSAAVMIIGLPSPVGHDESWSEEFTVGEGRESGRANEGWGEGRERRGCVEFLPLPPPLRFPFPNPLHPPTSSPPPRNSILPPKFPGLI